MSADADDTPGPQKGNGKGNNQGNNNGNGGGNGEAGAASRVPATTVKAVAEPVAQRLARLRGALTPSSPADKAAAGDALPASRAVAVPTQAALPAPAGDAQARPLPPQRAPALAGPAAPVRPVRPAAARANADTVPAPAILLPVTKRPLLRRGRKRISSSRAALLSMTSQEAPLSEQQEERDLLELLEAALMRLASIVWLVAAVLIWSRLIGYGSAAPTMTWFNLGQAFVPTLVAALLMPMVSVGLWLVSSWGAVIWAAAVAVSLFATLAGLAEPPFGRGGLIANIVALAVIGTIAGVRAWRDRDIDD